MAIATKSSATTAIECARSMDSALRTPREAARSTGLAASTSSTTGRRRAGKKALAIKHLRVYLKLAPWATDAATTRKRLDSTQHLRLTADNTLRQRCTASWRKDMISVARLNAGISQALPHPEAPKSLWENVRLTDLTMANVARSPKTVQEAFARHAEYAKTNGTLPPVLYENGSGQYGLVQANDATEFIDVFSEFGKLLGATSTTWVRDATGEVVPRLPRAWFDPLAG